jgi:superfamily II DNA or RNA helicase
MTLTPSLFDNPWPSGERFPLNEQDQSVAEIALADWEESDGLIMLTGFTSVEQILRVFGDSNRRGPASIKIVIGNEPDIRPLESFRGPSSRIDHRMRDYWLDRGISILNHPALLEVIRRLESEEIDVRLYDTLHGKVYVSDRSAIVGSSNFSESGFKFQKEVNVRFTPDSDRYRDVRSIAELYWDEATPYRDDFIDLLKQLLAEVSWQEALARSVSEILEGKWLHEYLKRIQQYDIVSLWPTQLQTISQAMYILDRQGSVLIADPTGSGKTMIGSYLLRILFDRIFTRGTGHRTLFELVCPPLVMQSWSAQNRKLGSFTHSVSSGQLSRTHSETLEEIRNSNVILIDEAHQYLSRTSNRSQALIQHHAEHVLLFTATPINKKGEDLFRMIELLGPDNLETETLAYFDTLKSKPEQIKRDPDKLNELRKAVSQFMVRHTKRQINREIDRNPGAFKNRMGVPCRYPKQLSVYYRVESASEDDELAAEINDLAKQLKGLAFLRTWKSSDTILDYWEGDLKEYVSMRIKAANGLSQYHIRKNLRSSRAALIEYLEGTQEGMRFAAIDSRFKTEDTGDVIGKLRTFRMSDPLRVDCDDPIVQAELPDWLQDESKLGEAIDRELELLSEISRRCRQISGRRETSKAQHLLALSKRHTKLLAFDSSLISTRVIADLTKQFDTQGIQVLRMTGTNSALEKQRFHKDFDLESTSSERAIAICTDALSEGINLQQASAVVFLDMPSVIRTAEQRAGRVDRLDSPHESISICWPDDSEPFKLYTDSKFKDRLDTVESVIGANFEMPEDLEFQSVDASEMAKLYEDHTSESVDEWSGMADAFESIRSLIGEGEIISQDLYNQICGAEGRVVSNISSVTDSEDWLFLCTRGTMTQSPQWILVRQDRVSNDQSEIVTWFKERGDHIRDRKWDDRSTSIARGLIEDLRKAMIDQLPPKRRRALELLVDHVKKAATTKSKAAQPNEKIIELHRILTRIMQEKIESTDWMIDWYEVSTSLLDILAEHYRRNAVPKKKGLIPRLKTTIKEMLTDPAAIDQLVALFKNPAVTLPYERSLVAAIVAVGGAV